MNSRSYNVSFERQKYTQQSFPPHTLNQWNRLPESVVTSPSLDIFFKRRYLASYPSIHLHRHIITFQGLIDEHKTLDLFDGVLIDLLTKDSTPELISLVERESVYRKKKITLATRKTRCRNIQHTHVHYSFTDITNMFNHQIATF